MATDFWPLRSDEVYSAADAHRLTDEERIATDDFWARVDETKNK